MNVRKLKFIIYQATNSLNLFADYCNPIHKSQFQVKYFRVIKLMIVCQDVHQFRQTEGTP